MVSEIQCRDTGKEQKDQAKEWTESVSRLNKTGIKTWRNKGNFNSKKKTKKVQRSKQKMLTTKLDKLNLCEKKVKM